MIKDIRQSGDVTVVELAGRFDAATAPNLKVRLKELIASGQHRLVLNLKGLELIDSSGLGVLVSCLRRCVAGGGDLSLAEVPDFARPIFQLTRLTRVFRFFPSESEAVESMGQQGGQ